MMLTQAANFEETKPDANFSATSWFGTVTKAAEKTPEVSGLTGVASVESAIDEADVDAEDDEDEEEEEDAETPGKEVKRRVKVPERGKTRVNEKNPLTNKKTKTNDFLVNAGMSFCSAGMLFMDSSGMLFMDRVKA